MEKVFPRSKDKKTEYRGGHAVTSATSCDSTKRNPKGVLRKSFCSFSKKRQGIWKTNHVGETNSNIPRIYERNGPGREKEKKEKKKRGGKSQKNKKKGKKEKVWQLKKRKKGRG